MAKKKVTKGEPQKVITIITFLSTMEDATELYCEHVEYLPNFVKVVKAEKLPSDEKLVIPNHRILMIKEELI